MAQPYLTASTAQGRWLVFRELSRGLARKNTQEAKLRRLSCEPSGKFQADTVYEGEPQL